MRVRQFICAVACLFARVLVCHGVCLFVCLLAFKALLVHGFVCLFIYSPSRSFVCLCVCLSVGVCVCVCVCVTL